MTDPETGELLEVSVSAFTLRPRRENSVLPKMCTLSGLSDREDGILLAFDLPDDFRDKVRLSVDTVVDSRERKDDVAEENVLDLELLPNIELLFICSV